MGCLIDNLTSSDTVTPMEAKFYEVGGCVRDELLGIKSKDIDFSVEADSFEAMKAAITARGIEIKVEKPEFVTVRGVCPKLGGVDYVLCRKDGAYSDGRRPDNIERGTLADDLARRDFTVNAMAKAEDGSIVDLFGGRKDLADMLLRCVGDTEKRMREDSLRMLRALRFSIMKGFGIAPELQEFILANADLLGNVSIERIRDEFFRCFEFDSLATLRVLSLYPGIRDHVFSRNLKLVPTIKGK